MHLRKTQSGRMGILTIPGGTQIYRRKTNGKTCETARKDFDVLALPSQAFIDERRVPVYSFKMRDEFWFVLRSDIPE